MLYAREDDLFSFMFETLVRKKIKTICGFKHMYFKFRDFQRFIFFFYELYFVCIDFGLKMSDAYYLKTSCFKK